MRTITHKSVAFIFILAVLGCSSLAKLRRGGGIEFTVKISTEEADKDAVVEKTIKSLEHKLDAIRLDAKVIRVEDAQDEIKVRIYGEQPLEPIRKTLFTVYRLELRKVVPGPYSFPNKQSAEANIRPDQEVLPGQAFGEKTAREFFLLEKNPVLTGEDVRNARPYNSSTSDSSYSIMFNLKPEAAERFGACTETNIGSYLAIVLNGEVQSVPIIKGKITDSGAIEGRFSKFMAEDISLTLNSGYLPATMTIIDERQFGN